MKLPIALLALALTLEATAQTRHDVTMTVDGIARSFVMQLPSQAPPAGGYPVVFMFHGTSGDGERFYNISGWKEKGAQEGFVTVFPSALEYCIEEDGQRKRTTKWNNGDLQSVACDGQTLADDTRFVRSIIDTLDATLSIDRGRIYASGFSNGAVFTSKLAVEMSDVFAALSGSAGILHPLDFGEARRNVPFVFTIGAEDDRLLESLGRSSIPFSDSAFVLIDTILGLYLSALDLSREYTYTWTTLAVIREYVTPDAGEIASSFTAIILRDLTHEYPNGTNHAVSAPNMLWPFFSRNALASSVAHEDRPTRALSVIPNPARRSIRVDNAGAGRLTVRDMLGRIVFEADEVDGRVVELPALAAGAYVVSAGDGSTVLFIVD